jgi:hypothetical protein
LKKFKSEEQNLRILNLKVFCSMNKRNILSLFLVGSLLGGLSVTFTGCIDNDEPEGIKVLREAKAGLLSAKQAVAAAEATKVQAEAQLVLAKAEVQKAKAEAIKLQAEADAAKTQAQADSIRAQIEVITADAQKALYEAEKTRVELEEKTNAAEIAMKKALLEFESETVQKYLKVYYDNYQKALTAYNTAYEKYITANKEYLNLLADTDLKKYDKEYELTQEVDSAEYKLAENQTAIAQLQAAIEKAATFQPTDLEVKKDSLDAILDGFELQLAEIELARQEALNANHEEIEKKNALSDAYVATIDGTTYQVIDKFSYTFPQLNVVSGFKGEYTPTTYSTDEDGNETKETYFDGDHTFSVTDRFGTASEAYRNARNTLVNEQARVQRALLDENDLAWAAATVTELTNSLKTLQTEYQKDSTAWAEAVAVYNNGDPDIKKFTNYANVTKALTAYNEAVVAYNAGLDSLNAAKAVASAADKAYTEALGSKTVEKYAQIRDEAKAAADAEYDAALEAYNKGVASDVTKLQTAVTNASNYVTAANQNVVAVKAKLAAGKATKDDVTAAEAALKKAKAELTAAEAALKDAQDATSVADALADKKAELNATKQEAYYKADLAYAQAIENAKETEMVSDNAATKAAEAAKAEADAVVRKWDNIVNKGYTDEKTKKQVASLDNVRTTALATLNGKITALYSGLSEVSEKKEKVNNVETGKYLALAESDITISVAKARSNVLEKSLKVYGAYSLDGKADADYNIPVEQLLPLTQDKIDATLATYGGEKDNVAFEIQSYEYSSYYNNFGTYGELLAAQANIEKYSALVNNPTIIDEVDKQFTDAIAALDAQKAELVALVADAWNAYQAQVKVVAELEAEFNEQVFAIKSQKEGLTKIQKALYAVIKIAEPENDNARYTQADIDKYIENLNTELTAEQGETESLEHAAERAQKLLEAWQAGEINAADVQAALAELRESELQNLKDQVDAAKAALDAAIAYLETLE